MSSSSSFIRVAVSVAAGLAAAWEETQPPQPDRRLLELARPDPSAQDAQGAFLPLETGSRAGCAYNGHRFVTDQGPITYFRTPDDFCNDPGCKPDFAEPYRLGSVVSGLRDVPCEDDHGNSSQTTVTVWTFENDVLYWNDGIHPCDFQDARLNVFKKLVPGVEYVVVRDDCTAGEAHAAAQVVDGQGRVPVAAAVGGAFAVVSAGAVACCCIASRKRDRSRQSADDRQVDPQVDPQVAATAEELVRLHVAQRSSTTPVPVEPGGKSDRRDNPETRTRRPNCAPLTLPTELVSISIQVVDCTEEQEVAGVAGENPVGPGLPSPHDRGEEPVVIRAGSSEH
ncbi:MAG TPA: hypothetical protein VHA82_17795 [Ramlibacter sp.]|uniref:hypothetical protein n=1 Tax=Ramlibacter sp. TaxID=1917967 RepID=UPI002BA80502|nr:hypothetical protein [Ramlibacter sp.]HVZ45665.1 hypothetical protein [Ramlibacter sp.]